MNRIRLSLVALLALWSAVTHAAALSPAQQTAVMSVWQLLDYMAVDYAGAVTPTGQVARASEYAEMLEFSGQVQARIEKLPAAPEQAQLLNPAKNLHQLGEQKSAPVKLAPSPHAQWVRTLPYRIDPGCLGRGKGGGMGHGRQGRNEGNEAEANTVHEQNMRLCK